MTEKRNLIVVHGEDVDGIVTAGLLKRKFPINTEIYLLTHQMQDVFLDALSQNEDLLAEANLIIADLSLKRRYVDKDGDQSILPRLIANARIVVWVDHHCSNFLDLVSNVGCNLVHAHGDEKCTAMLVYEHFLAADDGTAHDLACIAQLNDYPDPMGNQELIKQGNMLQKIVNSLYWNKKHDRLMSLINAIANDEDWQAEIEIDLAEFHEEYCKALLRVNDNICFGELGSYDILVTILDPILPQKEIMRWLRDHYAHEVEAIIGIFPEPVNNVMVFAGAKSSKFPVEQMCEKMTGGSRGGDGGFTLPTLYDWTDSKKALENLQTIYDYCFN